MMIKEKSHYYEWKKTSNMLRPERIPYMIYIYASILATPVAQ